MIAKILFFCAGMLVLAATPTIAAEGPAAVENFEYPDGPLMRQVGGTGFSGAWKSTGQVEKRSVILLQDANNAIRPLAAPQELTSPLYVGVTLQLDGPDILDFSFPVYLKTSTGEELAAFGISKKSYMISIAGGGKNPGAALKRFSQYTLGKSARCVLKLERSGDSDIMASLWINPTGPEESDVSGFVIGSISAGQAVELVDVRLWGGAGLKARMSALRLGRTWADVVQP